MVIKESLIRKIHKAYVAVYEMGDSALDALTAMPQYRKWLDADMDDDYLEGLDNIDLQQLFEEIEDILEDYDW